MQLEKQIKKCSELLYKLCDDVQRLNCLNYYDINISSENFFIHLINIIFDWNLKNENFTERNTAAIDLTDNDNRIAIQVTSDDSAAKIRKTLNGYREKKLYEQYDRLIIVVIKKRKSYTADFDSAIKGKFAFDKKHDIYTIDDLICKIQELGYQKVTEVCEYLEFQLGTVMDRNCVWNIETAFLEISGNTNGYLNEDFFEIDDYQFKKLFLKKFETQTEIHVNGSNKEEILYCILNQLHKMTINKETYIFRDSKSWNAAKNKLENSIVIPFFETDQIPVLQGNTNIFIHGYGTHNKAGIELRRRTRSFLIDKLRKNQYDDAYNLIQKTNGIYYYLKKELYQGHLASPSWGQDKHIAVIIAVLMGSWCQSDGDLQVLEAICGMQYSKFVDYLEKYIGIEMPLILKKTYHNQVSYEIADPELAWFEIKRSVSPELCNKFLAKSKQVISNSTNLYSGMLKEGILRSMIFLAVYNKQQSVVDQFVKEILSEIKSAESWGYIAKYMEILCEASPEMVISRLQNGLHDDTGMLELFAKRSSSYLWTRYNYTHVLWAVEMLLGHKQYAVQAIRWLMELSNSVEECSSGNNPREILSKVFCTWYTATILSLEDKLYLAEEGLKKYSYLWNILFEEIYHRGSSMIIPNQEFSFREIDTKYFKHSDLSESNHQNKAYYNLLLSQLKSTENWLKMIQLFPEITDEMLNTAVAALKKNLESMSDSERESIQYRLREIVYQHRVFVEADWKADECRIAQIASLCDEISFENEYYEFLYITKSNDFPILHPASYREEDDHKYYDENEDKRKKIVQEEFVKFKEKQLDISCLLQLLGKEISSDFGYVIAEYYSDGKYNEEILKKMLSVSHVGVVISDYIRWCYYHDTTNVLESALAFVDGYDVNNELFFSVLAIPPLNQDLIEMLYTMSPEKQQGYWATSFWIHNFSSLELLDFVMNKLFEYKLWKKAVDMIHQFEKQLPIKNTIDYMEQIISMINEEGSIINDFSSWRIREVIGYVEKLISSDYEQYPQLFFVEMKLLLVIGWENAKCVQYHFQRNAQLFAEIVNMVSINESDKIPTEDEINIRRKYYPIYDVICFCPGEINGQIDRNVLENWISDFKNCFEKQSGLFYRELGRLFAYSPVGADGLMPHEAVRDMIENYGNEQLAHSYLITTLNKRGVYTVTSGEAEHKIAFDYRSIADKFRVRWTKTAGIYDALARMYEAEAVQERQNAENYY